MDFIYSQLWVTPAYPTQSFAGQTVMVTGANVGLGFEAARHFVRLDAAKVILAVRNVPAGEEAKHSIETTTGRTGVCEVWELDLASYDSVKAFAARASSELARLDIVVENAGIVALKFTEAEGHERTITVNVINTFLLALLLLPQLKQTARAFPQSESEPGAHLCIVTSEVHAWTTLPEAQTENNNNTFSELSDRDKANMRTRYAASKLLEVFAVRELAPRLADSGVILNMVNPGMCHSQLTRDDAGWTVWLVKKALARSTEVGARTLVAAAAAGPESHGMYMSDGEVAERGLSRFVRTEEGEKVQRKVWGELCEILEGVQPGVTRPA